MTSDKIFELRAFYSELFESYLILSEDEISASLLDEEFKQRAIGWESFGKHIEYMKNKLESGNLNANRKELIATSLERQQADYEKYLWQPEARMIVGEGDRQALTARRLQLAGGYYYTHEKEAWQQLEAERYVANWEELPQRLIQEIDRKIETLDSRLDGYRSAQPRVVPMLTLAQEEAAFYLRWDEFRNVVNISFSTPEDDAQIIVYNPANPPHEAGGPGLWCPMSLDEQTHKPWLWLGFSQQKRDAIRLGFMQGICTIINISGGDLSEWRALQAEVSPHLYERYFNPITEQTRRTKHYAQGRIGIEKLLKRIYSSGQEIPYHPNFDQAFLTHLDQLPLYEVHGFLTGFCEREDMANPSGYTHLLEMVTHAVQTSALSSQDAVNRAISWLRSAVQAPNESPAGSPDAIEPALLTKGPKSIRRGRNQYTVSELYVFLDAGRREEVAAKVKRVWEELRSDLRSPKDEPAALAALHHLTVWLGIARDDPSSEEWRDAFRREWGVETGNGIGKYQFKNPRTDKYIKAVILAYKLINDNYPLWVRDKELPGRYR
jgi:hypothetical protein